jgi:hypothetical protein
MAIQVSGSDDPMKVILAELGGIPQLDNEELKDARDTAITLELTNRFAYVQGQICFPFKISTVSYPFDRSSCRRKDSLGSSQTRRTCYSSCSTSTGFVGIANEASHRKRRISLGGDT